MNKEKIRFHGLMRENFKQTKKFRFFSTERIESLQKSSEFQFDQQNICFFKGLFSQKNILFQTISLIQNLLENGEF